MNKIIVFSHEKLLRTIHSKKSSIISLIMLTSLYLLLCTMPTSCKVVKLDKKERSDNKIQIYFDDDSFDAAAIVNSHWNDKLLPYYLNKAAELSILLEEAATDPKAASEKYAYSETEENTTYNFIVKGKGIIISANTESRASTIDVDLTPCDGKADVTVQIGPVIKHTSVRDAYPLLSYADFNTQLEWASIKNEINKTVYTRVLKHIDRESLINKKVTFFGAFTLQTKTDFSTILITPVKLDISEVEEN
ncbi:MAG: DUF2291 domain-containing protein [Spirochaetales bacterium]|nr:DUF2291 domain-containing protein [Spirochaetales bacterium]